jgi:Domain of unknown function (DUF6438)
MKIQPLTVALLLIASSISSVVIAEKQQSDKADLTSVEIKLKREGGPCGCGPLNPTDLVCCPAYSISITGDGRVVYEGVGSVKTIGTKTYRIPIDRVKMLVDEFDRIDFFSLEDRYTSRKLENGLVERIDHSNATMISIRIGGKTKSIYDFYGAPEKLKELERKIEEVTETSQYTGRT